MDTEDRDHFKKIAQSVEPPESWQKRQSGASLHSVLDPAQTPTSAHVLRRVEMLCACYRMSDANDPMMYSAALAAVLSEYTTDVVDYVTDPRLGIPATVKWLPAIAEVVEACQARTNHLDRIARYEAQKLVPPIYQSPKDEVKPGQITYGQHLKLAEEGKVKLRPVGAFERGGYLGPLE